LRFSEKIVKIYAPKNIKKNLVIIAPAYNEERSIPLLLAEWTKVASDSNGMLTVINDGSNDQTLELLKDGMHQYDNLIVIDKLNTGHGSSCLLGYQWAEENGFQWIFQTDSDGQTKGSEFLLFWDQRNANNFIFGFRPVRGDGIGRLVISRILQLIIFLVFGVFVKDANVPFRLMRVNKLAPYLKNINPDMFLANAYLAVIIQKYSEIKWFKISFQARKGGLPSVNWQRFFIVGLNVIREFWKARKEI
jgi:dolichol-phosphate mannosyltransferase